MFARWLVARGRVLARVHADGGIAGEYVLMESAEIQGKVE